MPAETYIPNEFRRSILILAGTVSLMAIEGLLAWLWGWQSPFAAEGSPLPMAPATSGSFTILGLSLLVFASSESRRLRFIRPAVGVVLVLVTFRFAECLVGLTWNPTDALVEGARRILRLAAASRMTFFTTVTLSFASLAFLFLTFPERRRFIDLAGLGLSAGVTLMGLIFSLGYLYGSPLLYPRKPTTMAITAAISFFLYGAALLFIAIGRDLAIRKRDREALVKSEQAIRSQSAILQSILNSMGEAVVVADGDQKCLVLNPAAERIFGGAGMALIPFTEWPERCGLFQPRLAKPLAPEELPLTRAILGETVDHMELFVRGAKGEQATWLTVSARPLRNADGQLIGGVMVCRDITDRRRAEEERDRFFNLSRDMFCIAGFDGYFKSLNAAWAKTLGFRQEDLMAKPYVSFVHPEDRENTLVEAHKLIEGQETTYFENRYLCQDGTYKWLLWSARVLQDQKMIYAAARDITEHKESQEQIQQLNSALVHRAAELEALNKELEAFTYSVSHDLRAPVRHIEAFAAILEKTCADALPDKARSYLDVITNSARDMGRLIEDLLNFSRMARAEMLQQSINLNDVLDDALRKLLRQTEPRSIVWKKSSLPNVQADLAMIRQVFVNLLSNAVKYTRGRDPAEIEIGSIDNGAEEAVIFVRDNGVGFDMRYVDKLFCVFQRLHRADEFEGTGIGLANVRRIIARHGGRTWAEGKVNEGATFYFSLPKAASVTRDSLNGATTSLAV